MAAVTQSSPVSVTAQSDSAHSPAPCPASTVVDVSCVKSEPGLLNCGDATARRFTVIDQHVAQAAQLRATWRELVSELCFLQLAGASVADYSSWRQQQPPPAQLLACRKQWPLEHHEAPDHQEQQQQQQQQNGAQVPRLQSDGQSVRRKSAAPSSASTVQLVDSEPKHTRDGAATVCQQDATTIVAPVTTQASSTTSASSSATTSAILAGTQQAAAAAPSATTHKSSHQSVAPPPPPSATGRTPADGCGDGAADCVRHEADVTRRVLELRRQGLWSERRLPRVAEPRRRRRHWDLLLDEMQWLAADFEQERRWKQAAAARCAHMVRLYFEKKRTAARLAVKRRQMHLKSIAAFAAFEVRRFWHSVRQLVDVRASFVSEYELLHVLRRVIVAERGANRHGWLQRLRWLHADARRSLPELVSALPPGYLAVPHARATVHGAPSLPEATHCSHTDNNNSSGSSGYAVVSDCSAEMSADDDADGESGCCVTGANTGAAPPPAAAAAAGGRDDGRRSAEMASGSECRVSDSDGDVSADEHTAPPASTCAPHISLSPLLTAPQQQRQQQAEEGSSELSPLEQLCRTAAELLPSSSDQLQPPPAAAAAAAAAAGGGDGEPALLRGQLRPYQQSGWRWLHQLRRRRLHALLADESGLGRRVQTVALWAQLAAVDADWGPHLVVAAAPGQLLHWRAVCRQWCPSLRSHVLCPSSDLAGGGGASEDTLSADEWRCVSSVHVCVTSLSTVCANWRRFSRRRWRTLVVDCGATVLARPASRLLLDLAAEQRVLLGDVPPAEGATVASDVTHLWRAVAFVTGAASDSLQLLDPWLQQAPGASGATGERQQRERALAARLTSVLASFRLARRTDQLSDQLPPVNDNVILCPLQPRQRTIYDRLLYSGAVQRALSGGRFIDVMGAVKQLLQVCNHPQLVLQPDWQPRPSPLVVAPLDAVLSADCCDCGGAGGEPLWLSPRLEPGLLPCHCRGSSFAAARALSLAPSAAQLARDDFPPPPPLLCAVDGELAGGAAGLTLSRMASLTVPATVPQSRPTPAAPSPALVNSCGVAARAPPPESPPPTPPPSPRPAAPDPASPCGAACVACRPLSPRANHRRCQEAPVYCRDLLAAVSLCQPLPSPPLNRALPASCSEATSHCDRALFACRPLATLCPCRAERFVIADLMIYSPAVVCSQWPRLHWTRHRRHRHHLPPLSLAAAQLLHNSLLHQLVTAQLLPLSPGGQQWLLRDCGKLRLLEQLLRQLRAARRRVLLLAHAASVLDLLHRFVAAAGYRCVRIDATVAAHTRHALLSRFNSDRRLFCALVATRTPTDVSCVAAADTVIVYDADWCGRGESLSQWRCQRMACSGPLHIYRLVSEATVEAHMLQHVDETRLVRDLRVAPGAGDDSNCDPGRWRYGADTLRDLFGPDAVPAMEPAVAGEAGDCGSAGTVAAEAFEHALAVAVEEESDALALQVVKASQAAQLGRLSVCDDVSGDGDRAVTGAVSDTASADAPAAFHQLRRSLEIEYDRFLSRVTDLEYWAMGLLDGQVPPPAAAAVAVCASDTAPAQSAGQHDCACPSAADSRRALELGFESLTYPADQLDWVCSDDARDRLPLWCPPTPPRDDLLAPPALHNMYAEARMTEAQLPPVYVRKEPPRRKPTSHSLPLSALSGHGPSVSVGPLHTAAAGAAGDSGGATATAAVVAAAAAARVKPAKVRRDEVSVAPRSLFNRVPSSVLRMRRELQQRRSLFSSGAGGAAGSMVALTGAKLAAAGGSSGAAGGASPLLAKSALQVEYSSGDWLVHEDWQLLRALRGVQDLPLSLLAAAPAHVVNWELVCELVNRSSRSYRSAKFCRMRYDSAVQPREEGKLLFAPPAKKSKKHGKQLMTAGSLAPGGVVTTAPGASGAGGAIMSGLSRVSKPTRPLRTAEMMAHDKNQSFSQLMVQRFDVIRDITAKRASAARPAMAGVASAQQRAVRQTVSVLGVDYDTPLAPAQVAANRVLRLAKEKQRLSAAAAAAAAAGGTGEQQQLQQQQQLNRLQKGATAAVRLQTATVTGVRGAVTSGAAHVALQGATIVSVANLTPVQVAQRLAAAAAAAGGTTAPSAITTVVKQPTTIQALTQKSLTPSQLQALRQQTVLRHKLAMSTAAAVSGAGGGVATTTGHKLQVEVSLATVGGATGSSVAPLMATVAGGSGVMSGGQRTQVRILKQPMGKHMVAARTMTESEMAVILKQRPQLAASVQSALMPQVLAQVQGATPTSVTISVPRPAGAKMGSLAAAAAAGRPILAQSLRKMTGPGAAPASGAVAGAAGAAATVVASGGGATVSPAVLAASAKRLPAQLSTVQLVQTGSLQKQLPATVTVQQLQPMLGRVQSAALGGAVSASRLAAAGSPRQTIQVVSAATGLGSSVRQSTPVALGQLRPLLYAATCSATSSATVLLPRVHQVVAGGGGVTRLRQAVQAPTVVASLPQQQQPTSTAASSQTQSSDAVSAPSDP